MFLPFLGAVQFSWLDLESVLGTVMTEGMGASA